MRVARARRAFGAICGLSPRAYRTPPLRSLHRRAGFRWRLRRVLSEERARAHRVRAGARHQDCTLNQARMRWNHLPRSHLHCRQPHAAHAVAGAAGASAATICLRHTRD
jgi:hypothetical protein